MTRPCCAGDIPTASRWRSTPNSASARASPTPTPPARPGKGWWNSRSSNFRPPRLTRRNSPSTPMPNRRQRAAAKPDFVPDREDDRYANSPPRAPRRVSARKSPASAMSAAAVRRRSRTPRPRARCSAKYVSRRPTCLSEHPPHPVEPRVRATTHKNERGQYG